MASGRNTSGKPLSGADWLAAHHRAKLPERRAFTSRLASLTPRRVVDIGCATGLWLELLNDTLPPECEFIGIDGDPESLEIARNRAMGWQRKTSFLELDVETQAHLIPEADLTLAFNVFSYIDDLTGFLATLAARQPRGTLAVRQYDGASIRFGPMETSSRQFMESSLRVAVDGSLQFKNYDLDRVFRSLHCSAYASRRLEFELFERSTPFPVEFIEYYENTLDWTFELLSDDAAAALETWRRNSDFAETDARYFFEVDLVAIVS